MQAVVLRSVLDCEPAAVAAFLPGLKVATDGVFVVPLDWLSVGVTLALVVIEEPAYFTRQHRITSLCSIFAFHAGPRDSSPL